jgi:ATP-dependent helicase Lhr and Lhr-like helicase
MFGKRWPDLPAHTAEWLDLQREVSRLPSPDRLLVETFPHEDREHLCVYGFAGRNAMQTLGLLLTRGWRRGWPPSASSPPTTPS